MSKSSRKNLPTLLAVFILFTGTTLGVLLINAKTIFKLGAQNDTGPKNIRITNVTDSGFCISFATNDPARSFIKISDNRYFVGESQLLFRDLSSDTHYYSVENLQPEKKYFIYINISGNDYFTDEPIQALTGAKIDNYPEGQVLYGKVYSSSGEEQNGAIVYAQSGNGCMLSAITSENGNFTITVSKTRNKAMTGYEKIDKDKTLIQLLVQKGVLTSSVTTYLTNAQPLPPIILGTNQDARNIYHLPANAEVPSPKVYGAFSNILQYPFLIKNIYELR